MKFDLEKSSTGKSALQSFLSTWWLCLNHLWKKPLNFERVEYCGKNMRPCCCSAFSKMHIRFSSIVFKLSVDKGCVSASLDVEELA